MSLPVVLAVDGGNSKTDLVIATVDGALLAHARGPLSSPHHLGVDGSLKVLGDLLGQAMDQARLTASPLPIADVAQVLMAGVDFPAEEQTLREAIEGLRWARRTTVANDTFAVLRAGTERGWGVAVVCGAGINCVGVSSDGKHVRFPALGEITGDWGGGYDVGMAAVSAAARSADGRGPRTRLEESVPAYFGLTTSYELAEAFHLEQIPVRRVVELAPMVMAYASDDDVAGGIVDRLADEVVALAKATLERLHLRNQPIEVLLGGGLLRSANGRLLDAIRQGINQGGTQIALRIAKSPPIVGAALLALDQLNVGMEAQDRLRRELGAAVDLIERRAGDGRWDDA